MGTTIVHEDAELGERSSPAPDVNRHGDRGQTAAIASVNAHASAAPSDRITVMIGSSRDELLDTYLPRLAREPGFDLQGGPVTDPACIASSLKRRQPKVLLLDKALLDRLDARSVRVVHERSAGVRVLLLWDEGGDDLARDVLRNRFHGFLLTNCRPDICLKA